MNFGDWLKICSYFSIPFQADFMIQGFSKWIISSRCSCGGEITVSNSELNQHCNVGRDLCPFAVFVDKLHLSRPAAKCLKSSITSGLLPAYWNLTECIPTAAVKQSMYTNISICVLNSLEKQENGRLWKSRMLTRVLCTVLLCCCSQFLWEEIVGMGWADWKMPPSSLDKSLYVYVCRTEVFMVKLGVQWILINQ